MKDIFLIKPHSFIDVITNSSTELFVCSWDKTLEMVEELIYKIGWCEARKPDKEELFMIKYKDKFKNISSWHWWSDKQLFKEDIKKEDHKEFDSYAYWYWEKEKTISSSYWYELEMTPDTILIVWTDSNSMEREDQEYLEGLGFSRYHLG